MNAGRGRLALLSAMWPELRALRAELDAVRTVRCGGRELHCGELAGRPVVLALSGIGKVAAATTAALLLDRFEVGSLLFTGVAGGLGEGVRVGDVVVAEALLQHDLDASPLFPRYEVPLSGRSRFACDAPMGDALGAAAAHALNALQVPLAAFGAVAPRVHRGLVVSGDRFVATAAESERLRAALPDALAVEMEGAAVAQVCADFGVRCAVLRCISDRADDAAHTDFVRFIEEVASLLAHAVVLEALPHL
jgi:adenosylhomocysteine nucleosidase